MNNSIFVLLLSQKKTESIPITEKFWVTDPDGDQMVVTDNSSYVFEQ